MSNFWDILLLAIILWILFIVGAFIYYRVIRPTKSGRASRMEERISDEAIHEAAEREKKREGCLDSEIATQGKPDDA